MIEVKVRKEQLIEMIDTFRNNTGASYLEIGEAVGVASSTIWRITNANVDVETALKLGLYFADNPLEFIEVKTNGKDQ